MARRKGNSGKWIVPLLLLVVALILLLSAFIRTAVENRQEKKEYVVSCTPGLVHEGTYIGTGGGKVYRRTLDVKIVDLTINREVDSRTFEGTLLGTDNDLPGDKYGPAPSAQSVTNWVAEVLGSPG